MIEMNCIGERYPYAFYSIYIIPKLINKTPNQIYYPLELIKELTE